MNAFIVFAVTTGIRALEPWLATRAPGRATGSAYIYSRQDDIVIILAQAYRGENTIVLTHSYSQCVREIGPTHTSQHVHLATVTCTAVHVDMPVALVAQD